MEEQLECVAHDLRIRIDPTLCVSFGDCVDAAPDAFELDDEGIVRFREPGRVVRDVLLAACDVCPVDALSVWDAAGRQLVP